MPWVRDLATDSRWELQTQPGLPQTWDEPLGTGASFKPRVSPLPALGPQKSPSTSICLSLLLCKMDLTPTPLQ